MKRIIVIADEKHNLHYYGENGRFYRRKSKAKIFETYELCYMIWFRICGKDQQDAKGNTITAKRMFIANY